VTRTLPTRAEVDERFTWDAQSVFPDEAAWEAAVETVLAGLPDLNEFKGHLGDSPETLADWFDATERLQRLFGKVTVYNTMSYSVDVTNQDAVARTDRTRTAAAQLGAAMSFGLPEMIAIGFPQLRDWADWGRGARFEQDVYCYFKHEDEARGPKFAEHFRSLFGA